jgi:hypothetical protein
MCPNIAYPSLEFLKDIPEFNGAKAWGDWQAAIHYAETAEDVPAPDDAYRRAAEMIEALQAGTLEGHTHRSILKSCAVTSQGLDDWERKLKRPSGRGRFPLG